MWRKGSLKRILVLFLCTTILMTSFVIIIMRGMYIASVQESKQETIDYFAADQKAAITHELQGIRTALSTLANKEEIVEYGASTQGYRVSEVKNIRSILSDMTGYVPAICDVMLVFADGHSLFTNNNTDLASYMVRRKYVSAYLEGQMRGSAVYTESQQEESDYLVVVSMPIQKLKNKGFVVAFCRAEPFLAKLTDSELNYAVFCGDERIIACGMEETDYDADDGWIEFRIPEMDWKVILESPVNMKETLWSFDFITWDIRMIALLTVMECLLVLLIYKAVVVPIMMISRESQSIQSLSTQISNPFPERQELSVLVDSMNAMIAKTVNLTDEVNRSKMRMMEMEITTLQSQNMFLQAQINPHFLYNMLECICGMASQNGQGDIRKMTQSLSLLYRYCLKSPDSTLGEELDSLALYQKIISLRYEKPHEIIIDVPEDLRPFSLPRMILEPLVENTVQHAFNHESDDPKRAVVHAEHTGDRLILTIDDNGCGMTEERMEEINRQIRQADYVSNTPNVGIGMFNVAKRLNLIFGKNCSFCLKKSMMGGLMTRIEIIDRKKE